MTPDILIEDLFGATGISGDARGENMLQNQFISISLLNLLKKLLTFDIQRPGLRSWLACS